MYDVKLNIEDFKDRVFNDYFTIVYEGDKQNL